MAENKIRILDEQTINQIKGEVIENASSMEILKRDQLKPRRSVCFMPSSSNAS